MNRIISNIGLALCIVLTASLFGCGKTPEQESNTDSTKDTMSDSANDMKESASAAADEIKAGAEEMKDAAGGMMDGANHYVDDATITANVKAKLVADPTTKAYEISVETLNATVQLSGFVQSAEEKSKAGEIAEAVEGVRSVKNDLILKSKT